MKSRALSDLPARYQEQVSAQLHAKAPLQPIPATLRPVPIDGGIWDAIETRPSTDEQKLNKTEKQWLEVLRTNGGWIGIQCITLKLGDDCRYTPDFFTLNNTLAAPGLVAWEVKGFMRGDAQVKLKTAARMYPWISFRLVTKEKGAFAAPEVKP